MRLGTFPRRIDVSRRLLIDDDLGMLGDITSAMGEAAAQTEADIMVNLLTSNPALSDGVAVFAAARGNLAAAPAAPDVTSIAAARLAMRNFKGLDGSTFVNAAPRFLLVGPTRETAAEQLLAAL
jgi:phage major head subunit gpT-like protein